MLHLTSADLDAAGLAHRVYAGGTANADRARAPKGIITHTPSVTFACRVRDSLPSGASALELDIAAGARFDRAAYQPNFLIGVTGLVCVLKWDDQRPMHSGTLAASCPAGDVYTAGGWKDWASPSDGSGWRKHGRPGHVVYDWWIAAFPGAKSPLAVFPWGRTPNDTIGIDLLPDPETGLYSETQRSVWVSLVRMLSALHGLALDPTRVTTHSYASPCERGTVVRKGQIIGRHWDPDAKVWDHSEMLRRARGA